MLLTVVVSIVLLAYIIEVLLDHVNQSTAGNALDPSVAGRSEEHTSELQSH